MTRKRLFLETMEKVLKNSNKIIIDDKAGRLPYLPLNDIGKAAAAAAAQPQAKEVK